MYGNLINGVLPYAYLKIGNTNIYPGSIAAEPGLSVIQTLCGEDGYAIGNFGSAQLTMSVANNALPDNVSGQPITVYMGYTDEDETVTADNVIQVGEFYTTEDKIVTKGLFTTITAYDASYYAVGLYLPTGTRTTVGSVVTDVCTQAGLQIASDAYSQVKMSTSTPISDDLAGLSYRDVIAHCALLLGVNACIDRFGKLTFKVPGRAAVTGYDTDSYLYADYSLQSNAEYTMGRLQVNYTHEVTTGAGTEEQDTEEVTDTFVYQAPGTTSEKGILIETGSIKTQAATNTLGAALFGQNGFSLYGYSLKVGGRPEFDLADAFTLTDEDESVKTFYVLSHTLTYNGSLSSEFSASVPTEDVMSLDTTQRATLSEQVQQLSGLSARLNRVMADLVVATNAKFDKVVTNVLEADEFKAGVGTIVNAKIDNLEVNSINGNAIKNSAVLAKALSNEMVETALGVKVFYQAETPTATKVGDIWYVTVADQDYDPLNDVIKQWDGTDWVTVEEAVTGVFAANSITAQEIATETLAADSAFVNKLETELTRVGDPNGQHVVIDNDRVDIMDGDEVRASFGENAVEFSDKYFGKTAEFGYETALGIGGNARIILAGGMHKMVDANGDEVLYIGGDFENSRHYFSNLEIINLDKPLAVYAFPSPDATYKSVTSISVSQMEIKSQAIEWKRTKWGIQLLLNLTHLLTQVTGIMLNAISLGGQQTSL